MDKTEDIKLIASFLLSNDSKAFDKLVLKYQSPIRRFMLNLTMGDEALSDDLAQETFIKAYLNLRSFKAVSNFSTWLFRIAYNVFYDNKRTEKYWIAIENIKNDNYTEQNRFSSERVDIFHALNTLRTEERTIALLFYMEDKTHKEIAAITGYPLGTVKTHLSRGGKKLRNFLIQNGYEK